MDELFLRPDGVERCQIEKGFVAQVKKYLILLLIVMSISCDNQVQEMATFEVTVAGVGIDCWLVLIDFKESDLKRIEEITGSNGVRYHALNLDKKVSNWTDIECNTEKDERQ